MTDAESAAAVLSWSGGKDAAFALHDVRAGSSDAEVVELLTTVNAAYDRSTMHGVRRELVARQARAVGLSIRFVDLPAEPSNEEYDETMARVVADYRDRGIDRIAFADVLLEGVREYREERLAGAGVDGWWPIWGRNTTSLAEEVIDAGFRAVVVAVDGDALDASFAGREFDRSFLDDLPDDVDPCGENGEFHTYVYDGPIVESPVPVERGEAVTREVGDGVFHYVDLLAADG